MRRQPCRIRRLREVTLDHLRKVHGQIHPSITSEEIEQLSKNHLVSLMALVRALRSKKKPYVGLKEVNLYASELADQLGMKRLTLKITLKIKGKKAGGHQVA